MAEIRRGFSWYSLLALVLAIMACFGIGWSAFIKPTNRNVIKDGGQVIYNMDVPKIPLGGCAMWRLNAHVYYQTAPNVGAVPKAVKR